MASEIEIVVGPSQPHSAGSFQFHCIHHKYLQRHHRYIHLNNLLQHHQNIHLHNLDQHYYHHKHRSHQSHHLLHIHHYNQIHTHKNHHLYLLKDHSYMLMHLYIQTIKTFSNFNINCTPKGSDKITSDRHISSLDELNVIVVRTSLLGEIVLPVKVNLKQCLKKLILQIPHLEMFHQMLRYINTINPKLKTCNRSFIIHYNI